MPRYTYRDELGHEQEEQRKVEDRRREIVCPRCGRPMVLVISLVAPKFPGADRWR